MCAKHTHTELLEGLVAGIALYWMFSYNAPTVYDVERGCVYSTASLCHPFSFTSPVGVCVSARRRECPMEDKDFVIVFCPPLRPRTHRHRRHRPTHTHTQLSLHFTSGSANIAHIRPCRYGWICLDRCARCGVFAPRMDWVTRSAQIRAYETGVGVCV